VCMCVVWCMCVCVSVRRVCVCVCVVVYMFMCVCTFDVMAAAGALRAGDTLDTIRTADMLISEKCVRVSLVRDWKQRAGHVNYVEILRTISVVRKMRFLKSVEKV
jgi:hypothetical protein